MFTELGTEIIEGCKVTLYEVKCERKSFPSFFSEVEDSFCRKIASFIVRTRRLSKAKAVGLASAIGSSAAACAIFFGLSSLLIR